MDKPAKLAFSDEATFSLLRGIVLAPFVIIASAFVFVLITTDARLTELVVPCIGTSGLGFIWWGILGAVALGHRIAEVRAINHMFAGEIWECWQFSAAEWQALVEAECSLISPKDEGIKSYVGAVYSSILGIVMASILVAVGVFVIDEPALKSMMWILAVGIFLLLFAIGLFQPLVARYNAFRYHHKALRVAQPRLWFAANDIYHETLGHTSLKELERVTDQTRSRQAISFTLSISTPTSTSSMSYPFPVPSGCDERAGRLVRRYRKERLNE